MAALPSDTAIILAQDSLSALLLPFWQIVIGGLVLLALLASVRRLARRGRSRMTTGLLVTASAIIGLAVVGMLLQ
ncbi:hypothetical protein ACN28C_12700 [Plantactinospora sp. WMMC1484]|uniref:hypothetical protein n=1 Tax=Plantactinospora sp. WMMC1484 TaxID=3404122 RepID=UPI003BF61182